MDLLLADEKEDAKSHGRERKYRISTINIDERFYSK
jgi:hypothetical protein